MIEAGKSTLADIMVMVVANMMQLGMPSLFVGSLTVNVMYPDVIKNTGMIVNK